MLWDEGLEQFHCHCAQSYGMRVSLLLGILGQFNWNDSTCRKDEFSSLHTVIVERFSEYRLSRHHPRTTEGLVPI
jgi:hypothetical protein